MREGKKESNRNKEKGFVRQTEVARDGRDAVCAGIWTIVKQHWMAEKVAGLRSNKSCTSFLVAAGMRGTRKGRKASKPQCGIGFAGLA